MKQKVLKRKPRGGKHRIYSPTDGFIRSLANTPRFDRAEELALWKRMKAGDREAREQLILSQLHWAIKCATGYRDTGLDLEERHSLAMTAAVRAVDRFDPAKGRLSTILVWYVRSEILKASTGRRSMIHVPKYLLDSRKCDVSSTCLAAAERVMRIYSLDAPSLFENSRGELPCSLAETIPDYRATEQIGDSEPSEEATNLRKLSGCLPPRDREVIEMRCAGATFTAIAFALDVSKERVRQIQKKALDTLRTMI